METNKVWFFFSDDRCLTIVVVVPHVGSYIHFYRLAFAAICRCSNTQLQVFFLKRWILLQAPSVLQMLSITFYFTFSVWVHLEKTSQRRHIFQCQLEGYLRLAPCSGGCSGPLENLDWILWQDPHRIHGERRIFRRKKDNLSNYLFNNVISDNSFIWKVTRQAWVQW